VEPEELPVMLLEEETRPGELLPAYEDEHGTYIMNSKDLRAVHTLAQMGIDSFKIEGRTKSFLLHSQDNPSLSPRNRRRCRRTSIRIMSAGPPAVIASNSSATWWT